VRSSAVASPKPNYNAGVQQQAEARSTSPKTEAMRHYPPIKPANPAGHRSHWRNRAQQAAFRRMLLERTGHQCQRCGVTDQPLQAHHTTADDGMLVCVPCHKAIDPYAR
jgi:5-methylcytosine-specific restriction endonuclease McrA